MAKKETADTINETVTEALAQGDKITREAVDKSVKLAGEAQTFVQANLDAWVASATAATKGAQTLGAQIADMAKANVEHSMNAMKSLTAVKSVQEALEVQTNLTKEATERQMAEAKKIADASGALVQEVIKPLSDRAKAAMENVEHSMNAMKSLTAVKSVQEALEVQTNLTKEATERQMAEAKKIADASGALVQEVIKPLSDRAKAAMEKVSQ